MNMMRLNEDRRGHQGIFLALLLAASASARHASAAETYHVWGKVEIVLSADHSYENPYADIEIWVDLKGPRFDRRCYGFWDGGSTFRVRVLATTPGQWTWRSGRLTIGSQRWCWRKKPTVLIA